MIKQPSEQDIQAILICPIYHKFYKQNKTGLICFRVFHAGFKPSKSHALIDSGYIYKSHQEAKADYRLFMDKVFCILDKRSVG